MMAYEAVYVVQGHLGYESDAVLGVYTDGGLAHDHLDRRPPQTGVRRLLQQCTMQSAELPGYGRVVPTSPGANGS
jgi:hypothetical protein